MLGVSETSNFSSFPRRLKCAAMGCKRVWSFRNFPLSWDPENGGNIGSDLLGWGTSN